ncbi:unnamed protein product [Polarella glacialis]|uniref:Protein kinase domain-containing protein n=1 Tax=Polarella glacialis TaxID=89957 RepID=A0A813HTS5_POLGL|nr:unnamed protein product [Polarella glacialis]
MPMPSGSSHVTLWLHPARVLRTWNLQAASEDLRVPALRNLVERAAAGLVLSEEPIAVKDHSEEAFLDDSASSIMFEQRVAVQLDDEDLYVSGKNGQYGEGKLVIPLFFADLVWAPVPEDSHMLDEVAGETMAPQYILGVAPRPEKPTSAKVQAGPSALQAMPQWLQGLPDTAKQPEEPQVWLICVGGCRDGMDFQRLLVELGSRGAIRWDLEDAYRLSRMTLGTGGCSTVHLGQFRRKTMSGGGQSRAEQPAEQVAAKCLDPCAQMNNEGQIRSEISFLAQFGGHPNITSLVGVFCSTSEKLNPEDSSSNTEKLNPEDNSQQVQIRWTIVMELCPLGDLTGLLKCDGALQQHEALNKMCGVLSALSHLHFHRVVHRDVKVDNVLLSVDGQPVLADLGIAARIDDLEAMQKRVGTPGYAAPEVVDCKCYGVKSDIFSSGVLLYVMLSNTRPFAGPDTQTVIRRTCKRSVKFRSAEFGDVSGPCKLLLERLMSKEPKKRPTSQRSHGACLQLLSSPSRIPEEAAAGPEAPRAGSSAPARSACDDPRFNPKSCLEQEDEMWRRLSSVKEVDTPCSAVSVPQKASPSPLLGAEISGLAVEEDTRGARNSPGEATIVPTPPASSLARRSRWAYVRQARSNIMRLGQAVPRSNILRLGQAVHRAGSGSSKSSHGIGNEETSHQSRLAVADNSSFNDKSSSSMNMSPLVAEDVGVNSQNSGKGQSSELEVLPVKPPSAARPAGAWYRRQRWSPVSNGT